MGVVCLICVYYFYFVVSSYTNAFAFTQLCGILCAPWNGLIMDRHKGKSGDKGLMFDMTDETSLNVYTSESVMYSIT